MPLNRPDGRHWCAPEREPVPDDGTWTCPDCGTVWEHQMIEQGSTWIRAEQPEPVDEEPEAEPDGR